MPVWSLQLSCWSRSYPFLHGVTKICHFVQLAALSWLVEVWPDLHNPRCCQGFSICSWKTWMKRFGKDGRMCLSMPVYQTYRINELQCVFSQGALILFYSCTTTSLCVCLCVHQATKTWRWDRCYSQWALCAGLAAGFSPWLNVESKHLPWQKKKKRCTWLSTAKHNMLADTDTAPTTFGNTASDRCTVCVSLQPY